MRLAHVLLWVGAAAGAQAGPANDNFANRITIAGAPVSVTGDNLLATRETDDPSSGDKSVWWSWTAPASGPYVITAVGLPGYFQPFLGVYRGETLAGLTLVGSNAFNGMDNSYAARLVMEATGGTVYAVAVSTVGGTGGGFGLSIVRTEPPTVTITSPTNAAVFFVGEPIPLTAAAVDSDGSVTNVTFYLDFNPFASFDHAPYESSVTFTNGPAYHRFRVQATDDSGVTVISEDVLFLVTFPGPDNDEFADRIPLSGASLEATADTQFATREPAETLPGDKSVWWSWTAPASGTYTLTADGRPGAFQPFLGVYRGTGLAELELVAGDISDGTDGTYAARVVINAASGTSYSLGVSVVGGIGGGVTLTIVPTGPPSVSILSPTNQATVYLGEPFTLRAEAIDADGTVTNVVFLLDFGTTNTFTHPPYEWVLTLTNGPVNHRLRVEATDNSGVTTVSSEVLFLATYRPPANDDFARRIPLAGVPVVATGNNQYATREPADPTAGDKSVWWSWTAPVTGTFLVTAAGLGSFHPSLGVYQGATPAELTLMAGAAATGLDRTFAARLELPAVAGATYALAVTTLGGFGGELNLCVTQPALPGTPAAMKGLVALPTGGMLVTFATGDSSQWQLQGSTNLFQWDSGYLEFLPNGLYSIQAHPDPAAPQGFFRVRSVP